MGSTVDAATRYEAVLLALDAQDLDRMLEHYAPTVVAHDHAQQRELRGHDDFRAWCEEWLTAFPDSRIDELTCTGLGDWTVARFQTRGTNTGPMGPFGATGRPMTASLCSVTRWQDERIVEEHVYFDLYGVLAQLGHVPAATASDAS